MPPTKKVKKDPGVCDAFTWWSHTVDECKHAAESEDTVQGLSSAEAAKRLLEHGPNALTPPERPGFFRKLWAQINSALIWILLVRALRPPPPLPPHPRAPPARTPC
jgi:hypothetical protein